jgi:hypothetical protein
MDLDSNSVPEDLSPELFEFTLVHADVHKFHVKWVASLGVLELDYGNRIVRTKVSSEQWRVCWYELNTVDIWHWATKYFNGPVYEYSTVWNLEIKYRNKLIESSGLNAFPDEISGDTGPNHQFVILIGVINMLAGTDYLTPRD